MSADEHVPMPSQYDITAVMRQLGRNEIPVARIRFTDILGDSRTIDFDPEMAFSIALALLTFYQQAMNP